MRITIPVQNDVEVIIADVYVRCEIKLQEQAPIRTSEGKIAFDALQNRLRILGYEMADKVMDELRKDSK